MNTQAKPIELYYWPTPNGWKITIMLEELGVPYVVRYVNIGRGDQFEPSFLKIAPNNRMPAIIDPDGPGGEPYGSRPVALLADGWAWPDGGAGTPFPAICA